MQGKEFPRLESVSIPGEDNPTSDEYSKKPIVEIEQATSGFAVENFLGKDVFGEVFRGNISGREMAMKLIHKKGTKGYLAPECLEPNYKLSLKADVYAFGVTLLEVLCERSPWKSLVLLAVPLLMKGELNTLTPEHNSLLPLFDEISSSDLGFQIPRLSSLFRRDEHVRSPVASKVRPESPDLHVASSALNFALSHNDRLTDQFNGVSVIWEPSLLRRMGIVAPRQTIVGILIAYVAGGSRSGSTNVISPISSNPTSISSAKKQTKSEGKTKINPVKKAAPFKHPSTCSPKSRPWFEIRKRGAFEVAAVNQR
ncbi:hypothetical protein SSX86_030518 [Deinandra increscens subsp. villosa]|uniref:Protein kinase domain-containing protein n=1 Tax=Deinandra increscens subsp. villosa TaxID=3103831 RepID=A0AAP0CBP8_9ASTR